MGVDDYGNKVNRPNREHKDARRGSANLLRQTFGRKGYVPSRTGIRAGTKIDDQPFPDPPDTWMGTLPEWAIYWAHISLGLKPHQDFEYQYFFDNMDLDFFDFDLQIGIEVQGLYWHYEFGGHDKILQDVDRKIRVAALGVLLVFIDEDMALSNPRYYLEQARNGIDHSRSERGFV